MQLLHSPPPPQNRIPQPTGCSRIALLAGHCCHLAVLTTCPCNRFPIASRPLGLQPTTQSSLFYAPSPSEPYLLPPAVQPCRLAVCACSAGQTDCHVGAQGSNQRSLHNLRPMGEPGGGDNIFTILLENVLVSQYCASRQQTLLRLKAATSAAFTTSGRCEDLWGNNMS